jgi:uncharacterized membrane protein HdeD (DUF308 family)
MEEIVVNGFSNLFEYSNIIIATANNSTKAVSPEDIIPGRSLELIVLLLTVYSFVVKSIFESDKSSKRLNDSVLFGFSFLVSSAILTAVYGTSQLIEANSLTNVVLSILGILLVVVILFLPALYLSTVILGVFEIFGYDDTSILDIVHPSYFLDKYEEFIISLVVTIIYIFIVLLADYSLNNQQFQLIILIFIVLTTLGIVYTLILFISLSENERSDEQKSLNEFDS